MGSAATRAGSGGLAEAMRFEDALEENPIPARVGDVRLRYEPSLLIGEARGGGTLAELLGEAALIGGSACGISGVALILFSRSGFGVAAAAALALLAGLLLWVAASLRKRRKLRRRFVLNFATESLRLDAPAPRSAMPRSTVVHFDAIREVAVLVRGDDRFSLVVDYAPHPAAPEVLSEVLVDEVRPDEVEELRRIWRMLRGAFGLRPAPPASE